MSTHAEWAKDSGTGCSTMNRDVQLAAAADAAQPMRVP
jgi:hypothetical protein